VAGINMRGWRISTKILVVLLAALVASAVAGCANSAGSGEKITDGIRDIITTSESGNNTALKEYAGRGTPAPVALESLVSPSQGPSQFDPARAADTDIVTVDMGYQVKVTGQRSGSVKSIFGGREPEVVITTLIPKTIEGKQRVLEIEFSVEPSQVYDVDESRYAEFTVRNPEGDFDINIRTKLELFRYDVSTARNAGRAAPLGETERAAFLKDEKYIEKDHPAIQEAARSIQGTDDEGTVKKIYEFVVEELEYDKAKAGSETGKAYGAANALGLGKGVCVEYTDLFVALCRAKGIPAKYVGGIPTEGESLGKGHAWAEVYVPNYGWVPSDPTWGDTGAVTFDRLRPSYVYLTDVRNDEVLRNSDIYTCQYIGLDVDISHSLNVDSARTKYLAELRSSIDTKKSKLEQLRKGLDTTFATIKSSEAEINRIDQEMAGVRRELQTSASLGQAEHNRLVEKYNSLVNSYNEKLALHNQRVNAYQSERDFYEAERAEINAVVDRYNLLK